MKVMSITMGHSHNDEADFLFLLDGLQVKDRSYV